MENDSKSAGAGLATEAPAGPKLFLSRGAILARKDITFEDVEVPEWGGWIRVKALTAGQRDALESSCMVPDGPKKQKFSTLDFRAKLVIRTACDEALTPLFTVADMLELTNKSAAAMSRVAEVASRLSKITDEDVDELAKNFATVQAADSSSDSVSKSSDGSLPK